MMCSELNSVYNSGSVLLSSCESEGGSEKKMNEKMQAFPTPKELN